MRIYASNITSSLVTDTNKFHLDERLEQKRIKMKCKILRYKTNAERDCNNNQLHSVERQVEERNIVEKDKSKD